MKDYLLYVRPFSQDKIREAIWDCGGYKSPRPDGVNFGFLKDLWGDIKHDFVRFMEKFHVNRRLVKGSNSTLIVPISKKYIPQGMNDFQPISLVGCMYKVLAKVLANILKNIIGKVISDSQSTFFREGRFWMTF